MNIISLFSGAGGLDLGFEQEGFCPVLAYDIGSAAVETYNYNREGTIAHKADLSSVTGDDIIRKISELKLNKLPRGVVGGPPCQYFSNGNRSTRNKNDPRRILPINYASTLRRLNEEYELDFFVMENVYGLVYSSFREDLKHIIKMFEEAGFHVFYDVLDAYDYEVPQFRKRVFFVGWNRTLYPESVQYKFPPGRPCGLTVGDRIRGLKEPQYWARDLNPEEFPEHPNHWTMNPVSDKFRVPPPPDLSPYTRSFRRLLWDRPSYTVAYGHNEIHVHPEGHRRLSIYEAMLLQGFPFGRDGYRLIGNLSEQVTLVSDAVPPPLAAALAQSVREFMKEHPRCEQTD